MLGSPEIHGKNVISAGKDLQEAKKVLIMLHGRGGTAEDILSISGYLQVKDFALLAPQAANNTWYPYSFLAPSSQNEPWLSSALALLTGMQKDLTKEGFITENIYWIGFSQGACLALEYVARNATRFGGVAAFTGGLIGDKIYPENYKGDFEGTPIFIGSSNPDPHIPVERVHASSNILKTMNAQVTQRLYNNMGHTISQDEINTVNKLIFFEKAISDQL
jgi:phospholipase/carboxylesterase